MQDPPKNLILTNSELALCHLVGLCLAFTSAEAQLKIDIQRRWGSIPACRITEELYIKSELKLCH